MRLGLSLPMFTADVRRPLGAAQRAAAAGYDAVFAPDHVFPPGAPDKPALDPFPVLAAVARRHPSLRVGTLVSRASLRPVGLLAKLAAGLDGIGRHRAILGLGSGDRLSEPEHEALGIPFEPAAEERVAILEETAQALIALFRGERWAGGSRVPPVAGPILPPAHPELWIGGRSDAVIAAAARTADAWNGWALDRERFRAAATRLGELADGRSVPPTWGGPVLVGQDAADLDRLREERRAKGLSMDVWQGTAADLRAFAADLADAGCAWFVALPVGGDDRIDVVASTLVP